VEKGKQGRESDEERGKGDGGKWKRWTNPTIEPVRMPESSLLTSRSIRTQFKGVSKNEKA
jgi:hypothetical protein